MGLIEVLILVVSLDSGGWQDMEVEYLLDWALAARATLHEGWRNGLREV